LIRSGVDFPTAPPPTEGENTAFPAAMSAAVATRPLMNPCFGKGGQSCVTASALRTRTKSNAAHAFLRITISTSMDVKALQQAEAARP
jgi:hypothetical protein